jgi:glyoxylase-like metal-dependent hydrolase (beta-lactamase superfamily II)
VAAAGRWRLLDGDTEVLPGISVRLTPGHVPFHQVVVLRDRSETAVYVADLFPTTAHLPLPWIMGYDLEPLRTLESKRALLADAVTGGWRLIFEHDAKVAMATPVQDGKGVVLRDVTAAPESAQVSSR